MSDYIKKTKSFANSLATVGQPVPPQDLVGHTLNGLDPTYDPFATFAYLKLDDLSMRMFIVFYSIMSNALKAMLISTTLGYLHCLMLHPNEPTNEYVTNLITLVGNNGHVMVLVEISWTPL